MRVRSHALVLINWKGVFYERYLLDDRVTALEGDNGAGKTTVMIAAYVALLPDMTRLRFTNVGESDASGGDKGIWGRLGNPNRPSYAALVFDMTGEHVIAGVHLVRRGEPSVELTPFVISDLQQPIRLQDVFLVRSGSDDLVPELTDLRENVGVLGGKLQLFKSAKEYFAELFDRGITPLRLGIDDDRSRFNDMLRTSMTGGISRALTSEFRSFLLKEETGLADTLVRMKANLEACRRTRVEVREAEQLEGEISAVYEAGHDMFAASLLATRQRALELQHRVDEAREHRDVALRERDAVASDHAETTKERSEIEHRVTEVREQHSVAQKTLDQQVRANAIVNRIATYDQQLGSLSVPLSESVAELDRQNDLKTRRELEKARAEVAYRTAAQGLADLQKGLEELHRRADGYRTTTQRLEEARRVLGITELQQANIENEEQRAQRDLASIDVRLSDLDRSIVGAALHRTRHADGLRALSVILKRQIAAEEASASVRLALRQLADLDASAGREKTIEQDLARTRARNERQQSVRAEAKELELPEQRLGSSDQVQDAFQHAEAERRSIEEEIREVTGRAEDHKRAEQSARMLYQSLQTRQLRWRELDSVAKRLEDTLGAGLRTVRELDAARQLLDEERDQSHGQIENVEKTIEDTTARARLLEQTGGTFHRDLLAARDAVGGELLAGHFDDLEPLRAARMQALLGPLAEAIVVENAREAAEILNGRARELETIWLVQGGSLDKLLRTPSRGASNDHIIVENDGVVRTTQVPEKPTLGRKARERVVRELHAKAGELRGRALQLKERLATIDARRAETAMLTRELATLELGDPAPDLAKSVVDQTTHAEQVRTLLASTNTARGRLTRASERVTKLRHLLGQAALLDEPDLSEEVQQLEEAFCAAVQAQAELKRVSEARAVLAERVDALQSLPISDADVDRAKAELAQLNQRRQRVFSGLNALRYVVAHLEELTWADAQDSLSRQQNLVPALKEQCEGAARALEAASSALRSAEDACEKARNSWRQLDDQHSAIAASRAQADRELQELGVGEASDASVDRARQALQALERLVTDLDQTERNLAGTIAQLDERLRHRNQALADTNEQLARAERESQPANDMWDRLRTQTESRKLLTPAITRRLLETGGGSVNLFSEARTLGGRLHERLSKAAAATDVLEVVKSWLSRQDTPVETDVMEVWESVRDWLSRRVPAQIAELNDPLESLERLRQHLVALESRLESQETELRGASEDVARGIDVHIRTAHRQARLLNRELEGVHFGTIRAMRIRLERDNRMEGVLTALRDGTAQELLFAPHMPVEEALEQLFMRYSGRGTTLGQRLLDYREYLDIAIEIMRQGGGDWERVNPSRLSTGEAIGIGTALMMVVLTAWEQSANLFRAKRSLGTLRFLFLDEANRLSQDNLEVLFQLCTALDLQLLIASPEVASVAGCTTYRLVRRETPDGGEQVIVSGRRAVKGANHVGE
jgi:chromosome partition protein MukB